MTEENSGHLRDLGAIRTRGRHLADMIRDWASHRSPESEARVRGETVAFCIDEERSEMKGLLDSDMALDLLYPNEIAADAFFVRCFTMQLRTGEVVKFDMGKRLWVHTGEFQELRHD